LAKKSHGTISVLNNRDEHLVILHGINIDKVMKETNELIESDKSLSLASKAMFNMLTSLIPLLLKRIGLTSRNSSKPPSTDAPNVTKKNKEKSDKKPGGQTGHVGSTLEKVSEPDETTVIKIDRATLPQGEYYEDSFETREVFDIHICLKVTEYQAQVLINENGQRFVAPFPEGITKAVQYGKSIKAHAVYK
jgi:transposase